MISENPIEFIHYGKINLNHLKLQIDRRIIKIRRMYLKMDQLMVGSQNKATQTIIKQLNKCDTNQNQKNNCYVKDFNIVESIENISDGKFNPEVQSDDSQKNQLICSQDKFFENSKVQIQKMIVSSTKPSSIKMCESKVNSILMNSNNINQNQNQFYQTPQKSTVFLSMTGLKKYSDFTANQRDKTYTSRILKDSNKVNYSRNRIRISDNTKLKIKRDVSRILSEDRREVSVNKVRQNLLKRILEKSKILKKMEN